MISQQQILIDFSYTDTIPNYTKNPMTESKKFCMKGLKDPQTMLRTKRVYQDSLSEHGLKILDRCYTPKKVKVISSDITTKSKSGIFHSLIRCKFLIKSNFESFLFTNDKILKK